jgi:hypothetical protein
VKALKAENDALNAENSRMKEAFDRRLTALEAAINQPEQLEERGIEY